MRNLTLLHIVWYFFDLKGTVTERQFFRNHLHILGIFVWEVNAHFIISLVPKSILIPMAKNGFIVGTKNRPR